MAATLTKKRRSPRQGRWRPPEIEEVVEAFCGIRRKNTVRLSDAYPEVAAQWCYAKNCGWGPEDFSHASTLKAWWTCPDCKRDYKAQVNNRTSRQSGCSYCASKKVCEDNSFVILYPEVAKEWHPKFNKGLRAEDMMYASSLQVWWRCSKCRHEWQAVIADRTSLESGCPACYEARMEYARQNPPPRMRKHVVLNDKDKPVSRAWYEGPNKGFKPLAKSHPKIAKLWHPTKNGKWTPADFGKGSEAIAWWKCNAGPDHEWQSPIYALTNKRQSRCPFCAGRRVSVTNSLESLYPAIAKQWHPTRNGELTPAQVTAHSNKKVVWKCPVQNDHVWETTITNRTATNGRGCPFCLHVRVCPNQSLQALFPEVAAELHPTKNKGLKAEEIAPFSSRQLWWKCRRARDHVWQATPGNRAGNGSGCPFCAGKRVSITNSLASLYPRIAAEWHKVKNGGITPADVTAKTSRPAWWLCRDGHLWQQPIYKRTLRESGCPKCKKLGKNSLLPPPVKMKADKIDFFDI